MKRYYIDKFVVPAESYEIFLWRMNYNRVFMWKLDGFIEESVYERVDDYGNIVIVSVAAWENYDKMMNGKNAMQTEYKRIGFNPQQFLKEINGTMERGAFAKLDGPD